MNFIREVARSLAFRSHALRVLSKGSIAAGISIFCFGFLAFAEIRASVYAEFTEANILFSGLLGELLRSNLLQSVLFLLVAYIPAVIILSNTITGDSIGLMLSAEEYRTHVAALFPLWGALFLITAPLQWVLPQFLSVGVVDIGAAWLLLSLLLMAETAWAIRELNYLSLAAGLAVFALSAFTLPVFWVLTAYILSLPFFLLFPVLFLSIQKLRSLEQRRSAERDLRERLQVLTLNPRDADAHYQLGLMHLHRGNTVAAQQQFQEAIAIDPQDPAYHYWLGRSYEDREDWARAQEQYEVVYGTDPQFGQEDIFREVGKAYLHSGNLEKAIEFLQFFLNERRSDPQGRYWLAIALEKAGNFAQARSEMRTLLEHARSSPRFFRRANRKWIMLARNLLRRK
jgi:tetratricopeptide (TPR) repeat protein